MLPNNTANTNCDKKKYDNIGTNIVYASWT